MARILLSAYCIGVTVFMLLPAWIGIAAALATKDATWRTWAELVRGLASGWLLFVVPAMVFYALVVLLPQALANRLNHKELARQQAELQARARALNVRRGQTGVQPDRDVSDADAAIGDGHEAGTDVCNEAGVGVYSKAGTEVYSEAGVGAYGEVGVREKVCAYGEARLHGEAGAYSALDAPRGIGAGDDAPARAEAGSALSVRQRVRICLFGTELVGSSVLWRLLVSLLLFPLLGSLFFRCRQLVGELNGGTGDHFTYELISVLLVSAHLAVLPLLCYWLVSELLLRRFPLWFASCLRHCATAALLGALIAFCVERLDPALAHLPMYWPLGLLAFPQILLFGAVAGALLALLYRLPVQWPSLDGN